MPQLRAISIKSKLQRLVALTTVVALAITGTIVIVFQYANYRRSCVNQTHALAQIIVANSTAALTFRDAAAAQETLRACSANPEILSARIYTPDGQVFAEYTRGGALVPPVPLTKLAKEYVFEGNQLVFRHSIVLGKDVIGVVGLRVDMQLELQQLRRTLALVLACMLGAAIVALVVAHRLQQKILEPLLALAGVAQEVGQTRNYSLRASPASADEVGALATTFNDMLGQIQQRDREVSEAFETLTQTTGHLEESEERFRQLAENVREVFWMTTPDKSQMLYISPAYETIWGRSRASLTAEPLSWADAIHPDDRERVLAAIPQQVEGTYDVEYRIRRLDRSERWIHDRAFPIRDVDGHVYRLAGIAEDVTERKHSELALRDVNQLLEQRVRERTAQLAESEGQLRLANDELEQRVLDRTAQLVTVNVALRTQQQEQQTILDSVPAFIWYKDCHNRILRINHSAAQAIGKTVAEVEGHPTEEFYPDEAGLYYAADQEVIRSGQPKLGIVEPITLACGKKRWLQTDKVAFRNDRGEIIGIIVCATDITTLRQTEIALRETETRLDQTIQAGDVGLWDWDLTTNKVAFSTRWKAQIGYTDAEIANDFNEWQSRVHPDDCESTLRHVNEVIANPAVSYRVEFRFRHKDGSYRWILAQAAVLRDAAGKPLRMLGSHTDITPLKQIEDQLRAAETKYRLLVERVPAVTYTAELGEAGRWHYVSPQIESLLGFTPEEWMANPRRWYEQVLPEDRAQAMLHDEVAQRTGRYDAEYRMLTRAGEIIWVQDVGVLMKATNGASAIIQGVLHAITARKLAEVAMTESEGRYRQLVEQAPDAIGVAIAGKIAFINAQGIALLRARNPVEVLGRSFTDFVAPADQARLQERVRGILTTQSAAPVTEYTLLRLDGTTAAVEVTGAYITYQGEPAVQAVIRDVTARHEAATALRKSEAEYRRVVNTLQEGLCVSDANSTITFVNPSMAEMVGYRVEELVGRSLFMMVDAVGLERVKAQLARRRQGLSDEYEHELIHQDGRRVAVMVHAVPLLDEHGRYVGALASIANITARKLAEQIAKESQERLQTILDNSPAVIFLKGVDGKYLLINRQYETLFHVTQAGVAGKSDFDLFPRAVAEELQKNDRQVLAGKVPVQFEETVPHDDGLHTYVAVKFPLFDAAGEPYAICGLATDISDRQRLQRQVLEVSDREQRRIGQDLHDGLCQLLMAAGVAGKSLEGRLLATGSTEAAAAERIVTMVDRANTQAREIARGLYPVELQTAGLVSALRELATSFSHLSKVDCQLQCAQEFALPDSATAVHIYRIVQEAVTNAFTHGQASQIAIRLAFDAGILALSVTDNGVGLGEPTVSPTGMGLNIMAYRARMIGGTLTVQRRSPRGVVVELVCPIS
ncbi:MAG: PAS domain S-box protein [Verrucomicrobiota bacterium]